MRITTDVPIQDHRRLALFVKATLEGLADGFRPSFSAWGLPPIYESGVRFQYEPQHGSGDEEFASPLLCWRRGWVDCDDAVIWRIGELRNAGIRATCRTIWVGSSLHVQVRRYKGSRKYVEDPAIKLGAPVAWPEKHLWDL